ncbi:MAG TPA: NHLP bacteriocin system secretion protein, partial [Terriglobia bacterium]
MAIAFRQKALAKLKSPEELDEPVRCMWQLKRIAIYTLAATLAVALIWSIFGRLPSSGRGQGILMASNSVVPIQAAADGQVGQWLVKVGDVVKRGDLLGILEQPVIERQLQESEAKLQDLQGQQKELTALRNSASKLQKNAYQRQREQLKRRIEYLSAYVAKSRTFAGQINGINSRLLEIQKNNAVTAKSEADQLTKDLQQRVDAYQRLRDEKIASDDTLRSTRLRFENMQVRQKELDLQEQQLDLSRVQTEQSFLDAQQQIANDEHSVTELNLQLQELDTREAQQDKSDSEAQIRDENQVDDLNRTIDRYRKQLQRAREIRSEFDGRVLELTSVEGGLVTFGQRLIQLDTRQQGQDLIGIAYFQDSVGKYLTA